MNYDLKEMSITDLKILQDLAVQEFEFWMNEAEKDTNEVDKEISEMQADKFHLFENDVHEMLHKKLYELAENYSK